MAPASLPMTERVRPSQILGPVAAAVGYHAVLAAGLILIFHGDPAGLACVGEIRAGQYPYEVIQDPFLQKAFAIYGYDGQFYYALARSPFQKQEQGFDAPA